MDKTADQVDFFVSFFLIHVRLQLVLLNVTAVKVPAFLSPQATVAIEDFHEQTFHLQLSLMSC